MVNSLFRWFLSFLSIKSIFHVSLLYASFFSMFRNIRLLTFVQCSVGYMHMHSPEGESRSFWGAGGPGVEDSQWCDVWSCGTAWILHESTPFAEQPQPLRFLLTLRLEWKFLPRLADICIKCATAAGCLGYIIFFSFCVFFLLLLFIHATASFAFHRAARLARSFSIAARCNGIYLKPSQVPHKKVGGKLMKFYHPD